jgi:hypothetical protein
MGLLQDYGDDLKIAYERIADLERRLQKEVNAHSQTKQDLRSVGDWLNKCDKTLDDVRSSWREANARIAELETALLLHKNAIGGIRDILASDYGDKTAVAIAEWLDILDDAQKAGE